MRKTCATNDVTKNSGTFEPRLYLVNNANIEIHQIEMRRLLKMHEDTTVLYFEEDAKPLIYHRRNDMFTTHY